MKNFIQAGDTVTLPAPYAVSSGDGALVGSIFGVAVMDAAQGDDVPLKTSGVFELPKAGSQAWDAGDLVYWDDGNKQCTSVDSGNVLIGAALADVANGADDTLGKVRLNGAFGFPIAA
ncbi:MAG: DUF2190 family protein [Methyloligellaceae bacterium]